MDFTDLGQAIQELLNQFDGIHINFNFGSGAAVVAAYIFMALGLSAIARNRRIHNPWLAWIPLANLWLLGCISDQYRYVTRGEQRSSRKKLLTLGIVETVLASLTVILMLVWIFSVIALTGAGDIRDAVLGLSILGMILLFAVILVPCIAMVVIAVLLQIQRFRAYCDLFGSCVPQQRTLFSVLSIVASCIGLDLVAAILIFTCRNKEEGMPPRNDQ